MERAQRKKDNWMLISSIKLWNMLWGTEGLPVSTLTGATINNDSKATESTISHWFAPRQNVSFSQSHKSLPPERNFVSSAHLLSASCNKFNSIFFAQLNWFSFRVPFSLFVVYSCSTYLSSIRCLLFSGMHCWLSMSKNERLQWIFHFKADEHIFKQCLNAFVHFVLHYSHI